MCENKIIKQHVKPIVGDTDSYLVKKPVPDAKLVEQIVDEIRHIAESETQMLGR